MVRTGEVGEVRGINIFLSTDPASIPPSPLLGPHGDHIQLYTHLPVQRPPSQPGTSTRGFQRRELTSTHVSNGQGWAPGALQTR